MPGGLISRIRNALYDYHLLPVSKPDTYVISLGNLTWGGTGKTSLAAALAGFLIESHYRVAILSRGYGRKSKGVVIVSDGNAMQCDWKTAGDESTWLALGVPQAIVVVAEKRSEGIQALSGFRPDVILLDDAFQHRRVGRDIDILLVDASEDLLRQRVLPFGKLREPIDSIRRADAIVLTHNANAHPATVRWIANRIRVPVFHADYVPERNDLAGKKLAAFCGLGSPQHFFRMLVDSGAELVFQQEFRDHHEYTGAELAALQMRAEQAGADALTTTAKDAVKIDPATFRLPLIIVNATLKVAEESMLHSFLRERLPEPSSVASQQS